MSEDTRLRDQLAIERTNMAEERTSLAYIRTGMSLAMAGIFFVGYFPADSIYWYIGCIAVFLAVLFSGYGFYNHKRLRTVIEKIIKIRGP